MAVSRWCRALSAAPDRRHSPALDDAGLDDEQVEEEELEWRLLPRPTARIHSRHICQPAPRREGGGGGAVRIDRAFWSHQDSMAHCRLSIENLSRVGYERGHTRDRAPGTERLQRADDSCPAGRPLALSVTEVFDILSPATNRHPEPPHGAQTRLRVVAFALFVSGPLPKGGWHYWQSGAIAVHSAPSHTTKHCQTQSGG